MNENSPKRLSIGILAHVDAGKTTLTEALLYQAGVIRKLGRVDHKNAFLDNHSIERSRGITVFSKQAVLSFNNDLYTILDTPGHADFSAETERVLQVLDYAILLISGSEGVQSHTETLWELLKSYHIPVFIFVNKTDISSLTKKELMDELSKKLDPKTVDFSGISGGDAEEPELCEALALCHEELMNEFLDKGKITAQEITWAVAKRRLFPCFFGSALKLEGTEDFLRCFSAYTKAPVYGNDFAANVFKITHDEQGNRLTHLKVTGGVLKSRMQIGEGEETEKVTAIRLYSGSRFTVAEEAAAGTVCAVTGLNFTYAGQGLGTACDAPLPMLEPLFSYRVIPPSDTDDFTCMQMLKNLEQEDPQLKVKWSESLKEIHLQLMGEIQLEVLKTVIFDRFGMDVEFGEGSIAYKETVAAPVVGVGHYEPLRHYAEVHLLIEPLERGSGIRYAADCAPDTLGKSWQKLILSNLADKRHIGVLIGAPLTDVKITLIAGKAHLKHTEGGDFRQAACRAVRQGLRSAENIILEPWYRFELTLPMESLGRAMTDLNRMGAQFGEPNSRSEMMLIEGEAPAARLRGYQSEVTAYTKGKGRLSCFPIGYRECDDPESVIEKINYDCDSDLDNSADSVFCSRGAGYAVRWDQAPMFMHIKTDEDKEKDFDQEEKRVKLIANRFKQREAGEKELKEIFERTFGKIDDNPNRFNERPKARPASKEKPYKAAPVPMGPEYVLVDGYNIIFAWEELKEKAKESLEYARSELIQMLCDYQGYRRCELILVFDAYKVKGNKGEVEQVGGISIVYTKEAETADMYIEKTTRVLGKKHRVRVATSDGLEQLIILGGNAMRVSASEFYAEVKETEREIRRLINEMNL